MPKFAANLSLMFQELPFQDRFAAARAAGFEGVEIQFPYTYPAADVADWARSAKLKVVLHNLPAGDWAGGDRGLACDPARVNEFQDSVGEALAYARALDVHQLHCLAGLRRPGVSPARARATMLSNLRFAAEQLAAHDINLLIEPINTWDIPGYFLSGSAQAAALIADCGAPNLFLQYDVYHMQRMEGELANTVRTLLPLIRHVQIADTPGRHEPGTGEINFRYLLALLDELGYTGWVGCEYLPLGDTVAGLVWRSHLA
ncbi:MAG: hydroxypyruvate isomerase [Massilia sp.]